MQAQIQDQKDAPIEIVVPPGDCRFSTDPNCRLITRRIESCIAVAVHVPKLKLAALLRFLAPNSTADPARTKAGQTNPWLFGDTGIPLLFARLRSIGLANQDLSVYAIGGAVAAEEDASGPSGKSNDLTMRRLLWREGVLLAGDDTGGHAARSVWLDAGTGRIIVRTQPCASPAAARVDDGPKLCHFAS